jgi:hypothetical protein
MSVAPTESVKSLAAHFRDWEATAFGYGYGTGEPVIIPALKALLGAIPDRPYDHEVLEAAVGPTTAWLFINILCRGRENVFEYGVSPRHGWLTGRGQRLKAYVDAHTVEELLAALRTEGEELCYPTHCNCDGPKKCQNPFWSDALFAPEKATCA